MTPSLAIPRDHRRNRRIVECMPLGLGLKQRVGASAGPPPFVPWTSIAGAFWAVRGDLDVATSGSDVTGWSDQTASHFDLTQPTTALEPTTGTAAGQSGVVFDPSGPQGLYVASQAMPAGAKTWRIVFQLGSATFGSGFASLVTGVTSMQLVSEILLSTTGGYTSTTFLADFNSGTGVGFNWAIDTSPHVLIVTWDGLGTSTGNYSAYLDNAGQTISTSGALGRSGTDQPSVGARVDASGIPSLGGLVTILETVAWNRVLTTPEISSLASYDFARYGVP